MKKKIKTIYILTMLSIVAFCSLEGWWLVKRYQAVVNDASAEMFRRIVAVADETMRIGDSTNTGGNDAEIEMSTTIKDGSVRYSGSVAVHRRFEDLDTVVYAGVIADMVKNGRQDEDVLEVIRFYDIEVEDADINLFSEALSRVRTNETRPFSPALMKTAVDSALRCDCSVDTAKVAVGKIWKPKAELPDALFHPVLKVIYPCNPLKGGAVEITVDVPVHSAMNEMLLTFALSMVVALLLVTCLLYQLAVIRHQHKVADLQKGYTLTMLHELKRPLASLKLLLSFLRNPKLNDDDRTDAMNNASRQIDNLGACFNKLRTITYNEASEIPLVPTSFSLAEAVDDSIAQQSAPDRIIKAASADITVIAERQEIINVICNLLENALKYSDGEVSIGWYSGSRYVSICVSDKGSGVSDSDKKHIFERFYRAEKNRSATGMGLGLAYVRQVAEAHGGSVEVADNPGGGSVFTLKIPMSN